MRGGFACPTIGPVRGARRWIEVLEGLKGDAARGYDTVMIGHGAPVGFDIIDGNIAYLRKAKEIHAANSTAEGYAEALKGAYPNY